MTSLRTWRARKLGGVSVGAVLTAVAIFTVPFPPSPAVSAARVAVTLGTQGPGWSIVPSPNTSSAQSNYFRSVSCVSDTACMAVGWYFDGSADQTLIESWDGDGWSVLPSPDANGNHNVLNSVSCVSPTDCTAVGEYVVANAWQTLIESWNGAAWSIVPSPSTSSSQNNYLHGVSCVSATDCMAIGTYLTGQADLNLAESWNGSAWSMVPIPSTAAYINSLAKVSCTSASACTAVGDQRGKGGSTRPSWRRGTGRLVDRAES